MAAGEFSKPSVSHNLMLLHAILNNSDIAIAAKMQAAGAKTSMSRIMTQEKYDASTPYIAMKSLPRVHFCTRQK